MSSAGLRASAPEGSTSRPGMHVRRSTSLIEQRSSISSVMPGSFSTPSRPFWLGARKSVSTRQTRLPGCSAKHAATLAAVMDLPSPFLLLVTTTAHGAPPRFSAERFVRQARYCSAWRPRASWYMTTALATLLSRLPGRSGGAPPLGGVDPLAGGPAGGPAGGLAGGGAERLERSEEH